MSKFGASVRRRIDGTDMAEADLTVAKKQVKVLADAAGKALRPGFIGRKERKTMRRGKRVRHLSRNTPSLADAADAAACKSQRRRSLQHPAAESGKNREGKPANRLPAQRRP